MFENDQKVAKFYLAGRKDVAALGNLFIKVNTILEVAPFSILWKPEKVAS